MARGGVYTSEVLLGLTIYQRTQLHIHEDHNILFHSY
jgi:hypothetical protein